MEEHPVEHEIVSEKIDVVVKDPESSLMGAYLARPAAPGRYPGVIIGFEMFGVTAYIRDVTERVARLGYVALAPDFYHRTAPDIDLAADPEGRSRGYELLQQLARPDVLRDVQAAMTHLRDHASSAPRTGMVGLSLGGHIAYFAATQLDLAATAVFYPGWLPTREITLSQPDPTLTLTPGIARHGGRLLFLAGEQDHLLSADQREQIAEQLRADGVRHEMVVYPDAGHGFFCDERDTFHQASADDAWQRVRDLLATGLSPESTPR